jgi:hypothetical protein
MAVGLDEDMNQWLVSALAGIAGVSPLAGCSSSGAAVDTNFSTCDKDVESNGDVIWRPTARTALAPYRVKGDHVIKRGRQPHPAGQGTISDWPHGPRFNHTTIDQRWDLADDSSNVVRSVITWHTNRGWAVTRVEQCDLND